MRTSSRVLPTLRNLKPVANDPARRGQMASRKVTFGDASRYAVAAVHTRFEAVQWFVWDAERCDDDGAPTVVRQAATLEEALGGLS